jgi:hypothetical protein
MFADELRSDYFKWLRDIVCANRFHKDISYDKLLTHLHSVDFRWTRALDADRADWGLNMRYRFGQYRKCEHVKDYITGPCSVFEMMVALAVRCEEDLMDDPDYGDRTAQWFWNMIVSLGLGSMIDSNFDAEYVDTTIQKFLNREYGRDGKGGLFTLRHATFDARKVDIWYQLCWYLDEATAEIPYLNS